MKIKIGYIVEAKNGLFRDCLNEVYPLMSTSVINEAEHAYEAANRVKELISFKGFDRLIGPVNIDGSIVNTEQRLRLISVCVKVIAYEGESANPCIIHAEDIVYDLGYFYKTNKQ